MNRCSCWFSWSEKRPPREFTSEAMFSALDQTAQFYPWDPRHAELPAGFPQVKSSGSLDTLRVMGPAFSGSAVSLRFVLDSWLESRGNIPNLRFQIISGTATAIDPSRLSHAGHDQATFQATVPPDDETLQAVACYIQHLGYPRIAILTEGNTAYGQNLARDIGGGRKGAAKGSSQPQMLCRDTPRLFRRYWTFHFRCIFRTYARRRSKEQPRRRKRGRMEAASPPPPRSGRRIPLNHERSFPPFRI